MWVPVNLTGKISDSCIRNTQNGSHGKTIVT